MDVDAQIKHLAPFGLAPDRPGANDSSIALMVAGIFVLLLTRPQPVQPTFDRNNAEFSGQARNRPAFSTEKPL